MSEEIETGVSHIAYFRTDGGSSKLYTQEYVDDLQKELERLNQYIDFYEDLTEKQNKEIEKLNNKIDYNKTLIQGLDNTIEAYEKTIIQQEDKIERLNNIINELFEYLKENSKQPELFESDRYYEDILDKLQELKGDDK